MEQARAGEEVVWGDSTKLGWHLDHQRTLETKNLPVEACNILPLT